MTDNHETSSDLSDELTGALLDAAVAKALGKHYVAISQDGARCWAGTSHQDQEGGFFSPSSNWSDAGPIIDLYIYEIERDDIINDWRAVTGPLASVKQFSAYGPTLLIAAMRAFVASKTP